MKQLADVISQIRKFLEFQAALGATVYPAKTLSLLPQPPRSLSELEREIEGCKRCRLCSSRNKIVLGAGNPNAHLMLVGEAPGAEEDKQGLPFVGRAGALLTKILQSINFSRNEVYITNVVKCRPPGNRDPLPDEIEACEPFLIEQVAAIKPKLICALGAYAARTLLRLGPSTSISSLRGGIHYYCGIPLVATYHPAYLLRSPGKKRETWEDVKFLRRVYDQLVEGNSQ